PLRPPHGSAPQRQRLPGAGRRPRRGDLPPRPPGRLPRRRDRRLRSGRAAGEGGLMFFRNLTMFRFPPALVAGLFYGQPQAEEGSFAVAAPVAATYFADNALKPVAALEMTSTGFIPPHGADSPDLFHCIADAVWFAVGQERKILPASVVADTLARRIAEVEQR